MKLRRLFDIRRWLASRRRIRDEIDEEFQFHLDQRALDNQRDGLEAAEARDDAAQRFGDLNRYRDEGERVLADHERRQRLVAGLESLWAVASESTASLFGSIRRSPGLAVSVVGVLGIGLGASATLTDIVDHLFFQSPRHVVGADRVRRILLELPRGPVREVTAANYWNYPDYVALQSLGGLRVAGYEHAGEMTVGAGESAALVRVAGASAGFFPLLGAVPLHGRFFNNDEAVPDAAPVVVLSAEYWRNAYGSNPDAVGRTVEVSGQNATIVGIAPPGFTGIDLSRVDLWMPLEVMQSARCLASRGCFWFSAVGRLGDADAAAVEAEATRLVANGRSADAGTGTDPARVLLEPLPLARGSESPAESRLAVWLLGVSLVVLLVACANVANLLIARGVQRRRELSIRAALGASRMRLTAQAVTESVTLALVGGVVGLGLMRWGGGIVRDVIAPELYFPGGTLSSQLIAFTALAALLGGVASAIGPTVYLRRSDVTDGLRSASPGHSRRRSRLSAFLTNLQVAMSVVLLVGAGLFVRSVWEVRSIDLGLDVEGLLQARLEFRAARLEDRAWNALYEEAAERVAALPSVRSAAATNAPLGLTSQGRVEVPGLDSLPVLLGGGPYARIVSAGYFPTAGVAILRGRAITEADTWGVAVVSETMARALWPDQDALGRCLLLDGETECTTVVGVAEDAAREGFRDAPYMAYYTPSPPDDGSLYSALYIRADGDAEAALDDVALLLRTFSPQIRFARVETLEQLLSPETRQWKAGATLFTLFGLLALSLASVGLYAVLTFDIVQRTRELGVRRVLGAGKARLLGGVAIECVRLSGVGFALGLGVAYATSPLLDDLLFEVSARDPGVFVGAASLLTAAAAAAVLLPGFRATKVDATVALKAE